MFEPKQKEPKLSTEMQNILNRSIDEKNNVYTDEIIRFKYKAMKLLLSNKDLLSTLHNEILEEKGGLDNGELYRNVNVFDYLRLPYLKDTVRNFVCFEAFEFGQGELSEIRIQFRCVAHKDDCETDWDISRQDLLAAIIKHKFDWSNVFGMTLVKISDEYGTDNAGGYYFRDIVYRVDAPNNIYNKINNFNRL